MPVTATPPPLSTILRCTLHYDTTGARHIFAVTGLLTVSTGTAAIPAAHGRAHGVGQKHHGRLQRQAAGTAAVPVETRREKVARTRSLSCASHVG